MRPRPRQKDLAISLNKTEIEEDWTGWGSDSGSDWGSSGSDSWYYNNWWDGSYNDWDNYQNQVQQYNDNYWAGYSSGTSTPTSMPSASGTSTEGDVKDMNQITEYEKAEAAAQSLANEAMRTLAEARQATATARRDRGFGQQHHQQQRGPCYTCGGPHLQADCPDERWKRFRGKGAMAMTGGPDHWDDIMAFMKGMKGGKVGGHPKGGKSKGKNNNFWQDLEDVMAFVKGGKGKRQHHQPHVSGVNTYALSGMELLTAQDVMNEIANDDDETMMAGLEMFHEAFNNEMAGKESRAPRDGEGMMDTGATACAGPEVAVTKLTTALMRVDPDAKIEILTSESARPYFRFGDGRWGRAKYLVRLRSSRDNYKKVFSCFALPQPNSHQRQPEVPGIPTTATSHVPVLVGMDFLRSVGVITDLVDGYTSYALVPNDIPRYLPRNRKGHFMLDIVSYLTNMDTEEINKLTVEHEPNTTKSPDGRATITINTHEVCDQNTLGVLEVDMMEFHGSEMLVTQHDLHAGETDNSLRRRRETMASLVSRRRSLSAGSSRTRGEAQRQVHGEGQQQEGQAMGASGRGPGDGPGDVHEHSKLAGRPENRRCELQQTSHTTKVMPERTPSHEPRGDTDGGELHA